ncbi:MAG: carbohydrate ABC transporter permease [Oscillospiraceae bacterium]|nr:carbohydrate ABC transporter permease [Oscillospiraceae bacterium]
MIKSRSQRIGDLVVAFFCLLLILVCLLPLVNILVRSLSSPEALIKNKVWLWPVGLNLTAYTAVLSDSRYTWSLLWTAMMTVLGTVISLVMTSLCAYPLIYPNLKGKKVINAFIILTMYFSAGTIPTYLLIKDLGLLNNPLALVLPYCLSVFNMIIMRSFFYGIPESLRESAEIDGAGPIRVLVNIYLPLSTPVIATLALFYAVGRWNGYSDALMFISSKFRQYWPIQLLLYQIMNSSQGIDATQMESMPGLADTIKAATVMFATIPILCVYPWLQKYFIAGVTLGAEKG